MRSEDPPLVAVDELEQIGDVGGVERLDQLAHALGIAGGRALHDAADEFVTQPVVQAIGCGRRGGAGGFEFAVAHRPSSQKCRAEWFP